MEILQNARILIFHKKDEKIIKQTYSLVPSIHISSLK